MKKSFALFTSALLCAGLLLAGCGGNGTSRSVISTPDEPASAPASSEAPSGVSEASSETTAPENPVTLLVAAAASLENAYVNELIPLFQEQYPHITVEGTYDSSGKLQTQIEEGMQADVFMSAAEKQMTALSGAGLVDPASVVDLVENEIVLIAPKGVDSGIASFEQIAEASTVALGDPESVPAGQYAQEALTNLGVWEAVEAKTSWGTNVTEVLNWVAEGSADVGIVYATDAAQMPDKVEVLAAAPEGSLEKKVIYPVGVVAATENREAADQFMAFLQTPEAMEIFVANGFKPNI